MEIGDHGVDAAKRIARVDVELRVAVSRVPGEQAALLGHGEIVPRPDLATVGVPGKQ